MELPSSLVSATHVHDEYHSCGALHQFICRHIVLLYITDTSLLVVPHLSLLCTPNLPLQLQQPIQQRLCSWWAARDIHIHRHDSVTSSHHRVAIMIITTPIRTTSHRHHPSRLGHLIIHLPQSRSHLIRQCPRNNHAIRLPWTRSKDDSESIQIISRSSCVHHFYSTTCQSKCHGPDASLSGPIHQTIHLGHHIVPGIIRSPCILN